MIFDDYVSPSADLFCKLKWLPFPNRVAHNKAVLVFKCLNGLAPPYMDGLFANVSNGIYSLRSAKQKKVAKGRAELYKQSFQYSGAKIWNSLPDSIQNSQSLAIFKENSTRFQASLVYTS